MVVTADYVLQGVNPQEIAKAPFDVQIVETYSDSGVAFTAAQVATMKSGGSELLGYFNLGEAENYRDYWATLPKSIIGPVDPNWAGNYEVAFWSPEWKAIAQKSIDQMISAGYDGIYFDVVDEFYSPWAERNNPNSEQAMVDLIKSLKQYATSKDPDFKVWVNGAEELLDHQDYVAAIDGLVKEEVYYTDTGSKQPVASTQYTMNNLQKAVDAGKPVVVIEYVDGATKIADVHAQAARDGVGSYIGDLDLNGVNYEGVVAGQTVNPLPDGSTGGTVTPPIVPDDPPATGSDPTGSTGSGSTGSGSTGSGTTVGGGLPTGGTPTDGGSTGTGDLSGGTHGPGWSPGWSRDGQYAGGHTSQQSGSYDWMLQSGSNDWQPAASQWQWGFAFNSQGPGGFHAEPVSNYGWQSVSNYDWQSVRSAASVPGGDWLHYSNFWHS